MKEEKQQARKEQKNREWKKGEQRKDIQRKGEQRKGKQRKGVQGRGESKKQTEGARKQEQAWQMVYFCYFCLICGIILLLGDIGNFSYYRLVVVGNILLISGSIWLSWTSVRKTFGQESRQTWDDFPFQKSNYLPRKHERLLRNAGSLFQKSRKMKAAFIVIALYAGYFFFRRKSLDEQLHSMLLCLTKMERSTEDFTLLFSGLSFFLSLVCFFLIFVLKKGWFFYGITLPILFLGPMFGYYPSWFGLFLLVVFHIGNGIYHAVYLKWNDESKKNNSQAVVLKKGIFAAISAVLISFFFASLIPKPNRKEWMRDSVQFIHSWRNTVNIGSSTVESPSGKISRGNHYSSGTVQMEVSLSEKPKERIYLKNFTGGAYRGDEWIEAKENDFSSSLTMEQEENVPSLPQSYFDWRQFELIQYGKLDDWKDLSSYPWLSKDYRAWSGMQEMSIRLLNNTQRAFFAPYLSAYTSRDLGGAYHFYLFSWEDYEQYLPRIEEKHLQWFDQLEEPYREYVNQHYLEFPEERLPRFLALCQEHPLKNFEEITAFIRQTLVQYASYSQTPGFMPYGTDIAEYFLFDGQEGYCQHFATAAVLMYRMYGIPARYAAGYMAEPEDFSLGQDGLYHANLTDRKAHAWAEIYLGGPGWIPIEVTPASGGADGSSGTEGAERTAEPEGLEKENSETGNLLFNERTGFTERTEEETREEAEDSEKDSLDDLEEKEDSEPERENEDFVEEHLEQYGSVDTDLRDGSSSTEHYAKYRLLFYIAGICTAAMLLLIGVVWAGERWKRKKLERLGADEAYKKIVELLHLGGYATEFDGTEPDFPEAATKACMQMNVQRSSKKREEKRGPKKALSTEKLLLNEEIFLEEIKRIKACAFQTAYGREISSDKERKRVIEGYQQTYTMLMKSMTGVKKLKAYIQTVILMQKK